MSRAHPSWSTRFRLRQYVKGSLWVAPLLAAVVGAAAGAVDAYFDRQLTLPEVWQYSASTASTVLATIVGAMVALTGFVITVSVLVVQMATGTFSARYLRLWYRDRMLKALLAVLIATLTFSFALLRRVETDFVPNLGVTISGALVVVSLILFLLFLDRFLHRLRPVAVAALVADYGRRAFLETTRTDEHETDGSGTVHGEPDLIVRTPRAGAIHAVDERGLVEWARERDCTVVLARSVGDFVPSGATLLEVFGGTADPVRDPSYLHGKVALGIERTLEQDPAFAIRIMVDIAIRALSPAVNDPTTAVQLIDHLGETLRVIGTTDLEQGARRRDGDGRVRLVLTVRSWEDYLTLAVTEIREYGATAMQVTRRLRAMLEELRESVRSEYRAAVDDELARLDATVAAGFGDSVDFDRASCADRQGVGGPTPRRREPVR